MTQFLRPLLPELNPGDPILQYTTKEDWLIGVVETATWYEADIIIIAAEWPFDFRTPLERGDKYHIYTYSPLIKQVRLQIGVPLWKTISEPNLAESCYTAWTEINGYHALWGHLPMTPHAKR